MQTVGSPAPTPTPRGEFLCGFSKNKDVLSPTQDKYETQKPTLTLYSSNPIHKLYSDFTNNVL